MIGQRGIGRGHERDRISQIPPRAALLRQWHYKTGERYDCPGGDVGSRGKTAQDPMLARQDFDTKTGMCEFIA